MVKDPEGNVKGFKALGPERGRLLVPAAEQLTPPADLVFNPAAGLAGA